MIEITREMADQEILNADHGVPKPYEEILESLDPRERDVVPYVLDMFINKLRLANPLDFLLGAFGRKDHLQTDLDRITQRLSGDARVLDIGCGWGGLSKVLTPASKKLYAVDRVREHAIVTKYLCPEASVFQSDAVELGFEDEMFDFTILRGVIEHVGEHSVPTGPSGPNMRHQFAVLRELARITKTGGVVSLNTGNYLFPRDGETDLWFYHWLPADRKEAYKMQKGISTDMYWLLTWDELSFILTTCGLRVKDVYTDTWNDLFDRLEKAFEGLDTDMCQEWRRLTTEDPAFMSSWSLFAVKEELPHSPSLLHSNRCYYARVGGECKAMEQELYTVCAENAALKEELRRIKISKSWRFTQPLRKAQLLLSEFLRHFQKGL